MTSLKTCPQCSTSYDSELKFCPRDGTALRLPATADALVGQVIADRFHVVRKLGEGGMGQVFLAEHVRMGRMSAIKVMRTSMVSDPDAISRFNREAANASRIAHPNVAAIYDFGETTDGLIYLAMEYVDGEPLSQLLEREGTLSPHRVVIIAAQVASALDAAHDLGIVHRDLKPDNIMIAHDRSGRDVVKVVDFGIAKTTGGGSAQQVTRTGMVIGTPEYMSPEQLAGDPLDGRSDTYSLGLVVFHALTGAHPFPSESAQETMIARLTERPLTLAEVCPGRRWPEGLQSVLDRALARKADVRHARAGEFAAALRAAVHGDAAGTPANVSSVSSPEGGNKETSAVSGGWSGDRTERRGHVATVALPKTAVRRGSTRVLPQPRRRRRVALVVAVVSLLAVGAGTAAALAWRTAHAADSAESAAAASRLAAGALESAARPSRSGAAGAAQPAHRLEVPADGVRPLSRPAEAATGSEAAAVEPAVNSSRRDGRREDRPRRDQAGPVPSDSTSPAATPRAGDAEAEITGAGELLQRAVELGQADAIEQVQRRIIRALPNLRSRSDSVRAQYHLAEALIASGQEERACRLLRNIKDDPGQFRRAALVHYDRYCR